MWQKGPGAALPLSLSAFRHIGSVPIPIPACCEAGQATFLTEPSFTGGKVGLRSRYCSFTAHPWQGLSDFAASGQLQRTARCRCAAAMSSGQELQSRE